MYNVCASCGEYRADKFIDPTGPYAVCPLCGHQHAFLQLPLLIVTGANGTGKSTVCLRLIGSIQEAVLLDSDILWRDEFNQPETNYRDYFELWLRLCKNIGQSGRPVVLFGAGLGVSHNIEPCIERRYFSTVHYLALTCDDAILAARLRQRPAWRGSGEETSITDQLQFNRWFKEQAQETNSPITLLDTTRQSLEATSDAVTNWIRQRIRMSCALKSL